MWTEQTPVKARRDTRQREGPDQNDKITKSERASKTRTRFYSERMIETSVKPRARGANLERDLDIWLNLSGVEILAAISKGILNWKEIQFTDDVLKAMRIC